jgi:hypothetical protein
VLDEFCNDWIHSYVFGPGSVVCRIANRPIMKPGLPYLCFVSSNQVSLIRASTFDEHDRFFEGAVWPGRQEQVQMVRHENEFMQPVRPLIPAGQDPAYDNVGDFGNLENRGFLPSTSRHEVCAGWSRPVRESAHSFSG